jgi:hypothetical protein
LTHREKLGGMTRTARSVRKFPSASTLSSHYLKLGDMGWATGKTRLSCQSLTTSSFSTRFWKWNVDTVVYRSVWRFVRWLEKNTGLLFNRGLW